MPVTLRPVVATDMDFLFEVYASTRSEEVSAWGWSPAQQDAFMRMQFTAQHRSYELQYASASHDIILFDGVAIGRLLVVRTDEEIHLVDISLLTERRGKGLGTTLIRNVLDEGEATSRPVRLEVLMNNPAARLYERLGFKSVGDNGLYSHMEKPPS